MSYRKASHSIYDLKYPLVWIIKYRKPVLRGEVSYRVRAIIRRVCAELDVQILSGAIRSDVGIRSPAIVSERIDAAYKGTECAEGLARIHRDEATILGAAFLGERLLRRQFG